MFSLQLLRRTGKSCFLCVSVVVLAYKYSLNLMGVGCLRHKGHILTFSKCKKIFLHSYCRKEKKKVTQWILDSKPLISQVTGVVAGPHLLPRHCATLLATTLDVGSKCSKMPWQCTIITQWSSGLNNHTVITITVWNTHWLRLGNLMVVGVMDFLLTSENVIFSCETQCDDAPTCSCCSAQNMSSLHLQPQAHIRISAARRGPSSVTACARATAALQESILGFIIGKLQQQEETSFASVWKANSTWVARINLPSPVSLVRNKTKKKTLFLRHTCREPISKRLIEGLLECGRKKKWLKEEIRTSAPHSPSDWKGGW